MMAPTPNPEDTSARLAVLENEMENVKSSLGELKGDFKTYTEKQDSHTERMFQKLDDIRDGQANTSALVERMNALESNCSRHHPANVTTAKTKAKRVGGLSMDMTLGTFLASILVKALYVAGVALALFLLSLAFSGADIPTQDSPAVDLP